MTIKKTPPLELSLDEAKDYGIERVGQELDGNPVYAYYGGCNTDLYRLVIKRNGFPNKQVLVWFYTGREDQ